MKRLITRVDYVLKNGGRGIWDYEAPEGVDLTAYYKRELAYINQRLDGQLKHLVLVTIIETDGKIICPPPK